MEGRDENELTSKVQSRNNSRLENKEPNVQNFSARNHAKYHEISSRELNKIGLNDVNYQFDYFETRHRDG